MKALTLTQPYATLVALNEKRVETRSWRTRYRGPLAIHAGKGLGPVGGEAGLRELCDSGPHGHALDWQAARPELLPRGAVVARAHLVACLPTGPLPDHMRARGFLPGEHEADLGDYRKGRYAWLLTLIVRIEPPIPATGRQGLWTLSPEVERQVMQA